MATIDELRARGEDLFTGRTATPSVRADEPGRFSWFDAADGVAAVRLAARLSVLAAAAPTVEDGLEQALDLAEARTADDPTALVQQAMALFVTHDRAGRLLGKPRTLRARPELFRSSRDDDGVRASTPGPEPALDYWREDLFANEHHDHWHQVYPWPGIARFNGGVRAWAGSADRAGLAAVFEALSPGQDWQAFLDAAAPEEVSDAILPLLQAAAATADILERVPRRAPTARVPDGVPPQRPAGRALPLHAQPDARPLRRRAAVQRPAPGGGVRAGLHREHPRRLQPEPAAVHRPRSRREAGAGRRRRARADAGSAGCRDRRAAVAAHGRVAHGRRRRQPRACGRGVPRRPHRALRHGATPASTTRATACSAASPTARASAS